MQKTFIDQLGRSISIPWPPRRIISLVPSQTELLADLNLAEEVVGITKFCVHPNDWFRNKTRVGGTKQYRMEVIKQLQPDLIIGNKEENEQQQIEDLMTHYPVWMSDIYTLEDAVEMIRSIGDLTNRVDQAASMAQQIEKAYTTLETDLMKLPAKRVAYLIWKNPWMAAGRHTFIHHMLQRIGLINIFDDQDRYPAFDLDILAQKKPEFIYLSSEPFPFKEQHIQELQDICPQAQIQLVDGEAFSWYGSRLLKVVEELRETRRVAEITEGDRPSPNREL